MTEPKKERYMEVKVVENVDQQPTFDVTKNSGNGAVHYVTSDKGQVEQEARTGGMPIQTADNGLRRDLVADGVPIAPEQAPETKQEQTRSTSGAEQEAPTRNAGRRVERDLEIGY